MTLAQFNAASADDARAALSRCCGSPRWTARMAAARPFANRQTLAEAARRIWLELGPDDWREAFSHHPRIGELQPLGASFATTAGWAETEQAGALRAPAEVLAELAAANRDYEARFGHLFLVCASGKSATEMLALLRARLGNDPAEELGVAADEQKKITELRLDKLIEETGGRP